MRTIIRYTRVREWLLVVLCGQMLAFVAVASSTISARIRQGVFGKIMDFSLEEVAKFSTPSLITRCTFDVMQVQMFIASVPTLLTRALFTGIMATLGIWGTHPIWTSINLNTISLEHLTGLRVIHAYNAENYQQKKFDAVNNSLADTNIFINNRMALMYPAITLSGNAVVLLIYFAGIFIMRSTASTQRLLTFSNMIAAASYSEQALPFTTAQGSWLVRPEKLSSATCRSSTAYPGKTTAIIGSTGSGKTSILNLIPRLYDATGGEVLVDGFNVRDFKLSDLRERLGYVPQKSLLFSMSIAENIGYGESSRFSTTLEHIKKAAEIGQARDFIERQEAGYDTEVQQGGKNFSGGQRQRLTISRAISRNPEIYIFDDSFSALDFKTDKILRAKLRETAGGATMIIVAQRISTIRNADQIIVLDKGRVAGSGTHEELMASCKVYREMAESQSITQ